MVVLCLAAALQMGAQGGQTPGGTVSLGKAGLPTPINQPPDANMQMKLREQQGLEQSFAAANAERRKQIAADTTKLMKLASELKALIDKSAEDPFSPRAMRQVDEIEKLAHGVKEKMKLTAAAR
jgi:hypothetical protein